MRSLASARFPDGTIKYGELKGVFLSEDLTIPEEVIRDFEPAK